MNSLHQEVPKSILPAEYGGDGPSLSELTGIQFFFFFFFFFKIVVHQYL